MYSSNVCIRNLKSDCHSVLDVACGQGRAGRTLRKLKPHISFMVGIDLYLPALKNAKQKRAYDDYIRCDVRYLPIQPKTFDVTLCLELLEHLPKNEGSALLKSIEQISIKKVVLTTPAVFLSQDAFGGNPWQEHKSFWSPQELEGRNYKVNGFGIRYIFVRNNERVLGVTALFAFFVSIVFSPLVYFMPSQLAYEASACKDLIPLSRKVFKSSI